VPRIRASLARRCREHCHLLGDTPNPPASLALGMARGGMTVIVVVTHEMGFAREAADRVMLMDEGVIVEENEPDAFFDAPRHERTKAFLSKIL